jgi:hypothetical protein
LTGLHSSFDVIFYGLRFLFEASRQSGLLLHGTQKPCTALRGWRYRRRFLSMLQAAFRQFSLQLQNRSGAWTVGLGFSGARHSLGCDVGTPFFCATKKGLVVRPFLCFPALKGYRLRLPVRRAFLALRLPLRARLILRLWAGVRCLRIYCPFIVR